MDPNKSLTELRQMVDAVSADQLVGITQRLAEQFEALDEWLTDGGFLPEGWAQNRGIKVEP